MSTNLVLSTLPHTWIFDIDGTICIHNGYKTGEDKLLNGVKEFFSQIPHDDMIIFITSRKKSEKENLEKFLKDNNLRFDYIIYEAPMGERILINDNKPSGLQCAYAINKQRDVDLDVVVQLDKEL